MRKLMVFAFLCSFDLSAGLFNTKLLDYEGGYAKECWRNEISTFLKQIPLVITRRDVYQLYAIVEDYEKCTFVDESCLYPEALDGHFKSCGALKTKILSGEGYEGIIREFKTLTVELIDMFTEENVFFRPQLSLSNITLSTIMDEYNVRNKILNQYYPSFQPHPQKKRSDIVLNKLFSRLYLKLRYYQRGNVLYFGVLTSLYEFLTNNLTAMPNYCSAYQEPFQKIADEMEKLNNDMCHIREDEKDVFKLMYALGEQVLRDISSGSHREAEKIADEFEDVGGIEEDSQALVEEFEWLSDLVNGPSPDLFIEPPRVSEEDTVGLWSSVVNYFTGSEENT